MNCMAWRMVHRESVLRGRSHCTACGHELGILDLVPIFSWVFLRGRCRHCGTRVSVRYVAVEVVMAIVFALLFWQYGLSVQMLSYAVLASILCGVALVDWDTFTVPNGFILAGSAVWLASVWFIPVPFDGFGIGSLFAPYLGQGFLPVLIDGLLAAFLIGGGMLAFSLLFDKVTGKNSLGGGDVKLLFMVALYLGCLVGVFNLLLSCVLGLVLALVWRFSGERSSKRGGTQEKSIETRAVPFGPAIATATVLSLLIGSQCVTWYIGLFV